MVRSSSSSRRFVAPALVLACFAFAPAAAGAQQSAESVRDYWTPERMASALPGDALLLDVAPLGSLIEGAGYGLGGERAGNGNVSAKKVKNPQSRQYRKHGKVFFTDGGVDYVCSGTSVKSKTKSLVVTAGHCTHSMASGYVNNFQFVPAYKNGNAPYGEWVAKDIKTTRQWESNEDIRYDVGMATVGKLKGKKLGKVVGARGITFNKKGNLPYNVIGYPAADPYDGESMYRCNTKGDGTDKEQKKPEPTRVSCDMTGGSSGGGWVTKGKVNSVVSYGYECIGTLPIEPFPLPPTCDNPEEGNLFGPYFGSVVKKLYESQR